MGRRGNVEIHLPAIKEEGGGDFGAAFSGDLGNGGDQSSIPEQQDAINEMLENVELGGAR